MRYLYFVAITLLASATIANQIFNEEGKVCDSEQCKITDIIKNLIDKTIDPCDNFYNYVCGNWKTSYPIPDGKDVWNFEKITENEVNLEVKGILEDDDDSDDPTPLKYERWWYQSCMDLDQIEEDGIKSLNELLDYFGGWPIAMNVSDWKDDGHDWQSIHEYYSTFKDLSSIFDVNLTTDDRNASRNVIALNKPLETLYDRLLKNINKETIESKYLEFIKNVVTVLTTAANKSLSDDDLAKDAGDIFNFENSLRQIKVSVNESEDVENSRNYMNIRDLQEFYNEASRTNPTADINWLGVFTVIFDGLDNITIDDTEDIRIEDTFYFRRLARLLDDTPNRVIVNYVHWKFVASSIKFTNKEMRDLYWRVTASDDNAVVAPERWEECKADMRLGLGYRYEYIRRHLTENTRKMIADMASEMRGEMLDEMEHANWLDENTKEETMMKLHAMKWFIGATNFYLRRDLIEPAYDGLLITTNYLQNVQNAREFFKDRQLKHLRHHRVNNRHLRVDPLKAKTFYEPSRNLLVVTAAQLSVPLLHSSLPTSVNYGYMAPNMGQLMSRTLEKEVTTNAYMAPWSTSFGETYKSYESKTECLTKQYYNYSVGQSTIDENMYDAIGLKVAYNAYKSNNIVDNETIEKLPELEDFSDEQLFFVAFALKHCQSESEKYAYEHTPMFNTPSDYKVIGTLVNHKGFAEAFGCPLNSPMNPENKCDV